MRSRLSLTHFGAVLNQRQVPGQYDPLPFEQKRKFVACRGEDGADSITFELGPGALIVDNNDTLVLLVIGTLFTLEARTDSRTNKASVIFHGDISNFSERGILITDNKLSTPPFFYPKDNSSVTLFSEVGRRADRPFMILATFAETSLGDLISKVAFVTNLKDQFDHARLIVRYNDFRPYSREVIALSPNIDHAEAIVGESPKWLRKFLHDVRLWRPLSGAITRSKRSHEAFYDLIVLDSMANSRTVHVFEPVTPLRVPTEHHDRLTRQLLEFGLDPKKCFAVVHYRDGSYALKSSNAVRNGDPESYRRAIDYIIENLGCQVVRIGHPEMTDLPAREGLIDLSPIKESFMLQAFAVSRARFMIGGASGPASLGWSFGVPTAVCDSAEVHSTWGSSHNIFLTHEVTTPTGKILKNKTLYDSGLLDVRELTRRFKEGEKYTLRKNTGEEISEAASYLHEHTKDVQAWRSEVAPAEKVRPNSFTWPPQAIWNTKFLDI